MLEESENPNDHVNAKVLSDLLDKDFEVEIQLEQTDILNELWMQEPNNETTDYVLDSADNDYFIDYLEENGYKVTEGDEKPLLASDFNAYDFKRKMCDLFETSYHLDSFDLVKLFAEKLKVDYLLWKWQNILSQKKHLWSAEPPERRFQRRRQT